MPQSLDEIMSERSGDEPEPQSQPDTSTEAPSGPQRDAQGRFAQPEQSQPPQGPDAPQEGSQGAQPQEGFVPQQALHAARQEAREAREQFAAMRAQNELMQRQYADLMGRLQQGPAAPPPPPQTAPDLFENPDAALNFRFDQRLKPIDEWRQTFEQQTQERELRRNVELSELRAMVQHGPDVLNAATDAFRQAAETDPFLQALAQHFLRTPDPASNFIRWHQTVGGQQAPRAPQQAPPQQPPAQPAGNQPMPSSFTSAPNQGTRAQPAWSGPRPLSEIMGR